MTNRLLGCIGEGGGFNSADFPLSYFLLLNDVGVDICFFGG
jgi:hypothetical protein